MSLDYSWLASFQIHTFLQFFHSTLPKMFRKIILFAFCSISFPWMVTTIYSIETYMPLNCPNKDILRTYSVYSRQIIEKNIWLLLSKQKKVNIGADGYPLRSMHANHLYFIKIPTDHTFKGNKVTNLRNNSKVCTIQIERGNRLCLFLFAKEKFV